MRASTHFIRWIFRSFSLQLWDEPLQPFQPRFSLTCCQVRHVAARTTFAKTHFFVLSVNICKSVVTIARERAVDSSLMISSAWESLEFWNVAEKEQIWNLTELKIMTALRKCALLPEKYGRSTKSAGMNYATANPACFSARACLFCDLLTL